MQFAIVHGMGTRLQDRVVRLSWDVIHDHASLSSIHASHFHMYFVYIG